MTAPRKSGWRWMFWLLAGTLIVWGSFYLDDTVDHALDVSRNKTWFPVAWWFSKLGEGWPPALAGAILAAIYIALNRPNVAARMVYVVLTCELTGFVAMITRTVIGRTRPLAHAPQGFYGPWYDGHWIIGQYQFSAFPSGHTGTAAGLAAAAWMVHRGWGTAAAFYALGVLWSRVALQAHHLSDVLAAVMLAIIVAMLAKPKLLPFAETQCAKLNRAVHRGKEG